jgi:alcohol dehydrogenase class IV
MRFEFATATRIIFGDGALAEIGALARIMGRRALVTTGISAAQAQPLLDLLSAGGVSATTLVVAAEPDLPLIRRGVQQAQAEGCDLLIGFGGGSALDAGKAIAALLTNGGDPLDYLEVIGKGQPLTNAPAPYIAIPTTAGTGAEVTRNAVLASPEHRVKASLRSPLMLPRLALVDPVLTYTMPPAVTASTGLDALTQVIEPFVSARANPMTDAFCREGMVRGARSLRRAWQRGDDAAAREDMALTSLLGGLALANAGLGAVHGIASVVGGMFAAPHGAVCARLLPAVMAMNVRALRRRQTTGDAVRRFDEVARLLTGRADANAGDGVVWVQRLCSDLHIPRLSAYGLTCQDIAAVAEKSLVASSTKANPIALTIEEMTEIMEEAV